MTAIFRVNQPTTGKTTIRFEWAADTIKLQTIVGNAAQLLHSRGLGPVDAEDTQIPWADLSNQQKLNIVDSYILNTIIGLARQQRVEQAVDTARDEVVATPEEDELDE